MTSDGAVLTVNNVGGHHAGRYECRVVDEATEDVTERRIFILVETGINYAISINVNLKLMVTFNCYYWH